MGDRARGAVGEDDLDALVVEQLGVLLEDGVAGLGEDFDERGFVQFVENAEHRKASDELGNEAVLEQVLRLGLAKKLGVALRADRSDVMLLRGIALGLE